MSKAVLISINPKWCEKIANGEKTIEIRKTRPHIILPVKVYIYETKGYERVGNDNLNFVIGGKGRGMVIGEFECHNIFTVYYDSDIRYGIDYPNEYAKAIMEKSNLTLWEMLDYFDGKDGYAWVISDLKIYDEPKELSQFEARKDCGGYFKWHKLTRPPQSWQFVEELE